MKSLCLSVAIALVVLGPSNEASAYHSARKRNVSAMAFVLQKGEWQVGPFRVDYGALEQLTIGTYVAPWVFLFPNIQFKILAFQSERWSVSLRPGLFYEDLELPPKLYGVGPADTTIKLWVIPLEGYASFIINPRFTLTAAAVYTAVAGKGSYNPSDYEGTAAAANAQVGLGLEWRVNNVTAFNFQARYVAFQSANGVGTVTVEVDDVTSADVEAQGTARGADASNGFSVTAYAHFSWQTFNLKVGAGYGNYNVPGMNLVVPERHPYPVFDLYWRF
jgi:hypothetical protein